MRAPPLAALLLHALFTGGCGCGSGSAVKSPPTPTRKNSKSHPHQKLKPRSPKCIGSPAHLSRNRAAHPRALL